MKILAMDTTENTAAVAICEDSTLLASFHLIKTRTQSEAMLPMIDAVLKQLMLGIDDIDLFAVSAGPGSFTGVRIGAATVKGLTFGKDKPIIPVSAIEAMAWNHPYASGIVCPGMDARRGQLYNALFRYEKGIPLRLTPDRVILLPELMKELAEEYAEVPVAFCGSGCAMMTSAANEAGIPIFTVPEPLRFEHAYGVALCALRTYETDPNCVVTDRTLTPTYLRASQAERERLEREGKSV